MHANGAERTRNCGSWGMYWNFSSIWYMTGLAGHGAVCGARTRTGWRGCVMLAKKVCAPQSQHTTRCGSTMLLTCAIQRMQTVRPLRVRRQHALENIFHAVVRARTYVEQREPLLVGERRGPGVRYPLRVVDRVVGGHPPHERGRHQVVGDRAQPAAAKRQRVHRDARIGLVCMQIGRSAHVTAPRAQSAGARPHIKRV